MTEQRPDDAPASDYPDQTDAVQQQEPDEETPAHHDRAHVIDAEANPADVVEQETDVLDEEDGYPQG